MIRTTDQALIEKTLKGDTNSFGLLIDRYQNYAFTIAVRIVKNREEAEEVAQDAFVKAYHSLRSYRGEAKFSSWLYRIVYHKALDRIKGRRNSHHFEIIEEITQDRVEALGNGLDEILETERNRKVKACIDQLPEVESAIVTMYYFEDLSVKDISEITGLSEDNVKIKLFRSRKKLFGLLENYMKSEFRENGKAI